MNLYLGVDESVSLRYRKNIVDNSKAVVLINHGFAEHLGRYEHVKNFFISSGYSVYRYDLRGHGKTTGKKGHIDSYEKFISDCDKMVELIKKDNPNKDIFMLGHSMGGLVTFIYGINYPNSLKGQIFSGPAVATLPHVEGYKGILLRIFSRIFPNINIPNVIGNDICSVEEVVKDYKNDKDVLKEVSLSLLNEFLIKAPKFVKKHIEEYKYPCLICHGEEDQIVPLEIGEYLYENISSEDKEILVYEDLFHEILNEEEKFDILEDMVGWMDERFGKE